MRITNSLKQRLSWIAFQVAFGQLRDLNALIAVLETFLEEAKAQVK